MSQSEKARLYSELKEAGVQFDRHYREYNTEEFQKAVTELRSSPEYQAPPPPQPLPPQMPVARPGRVDEYPTQHAYQAINEEDPIRTDPDGTVWYRDEVRKPASPKPRARRKLTYLDPGTKAETVVSGQFLETFEVAGSATRTSEVMITLPSYQVGVYSDPRFPFKIHIYNDNRGFDLFDVHKFYGGADLVPQEILRTYIGNDLCYDMRSTIRAIETEARRLMLKGN